MLLGARGRRSLRLLGSQQHGARVIILVVKARFLHGLIAPLLLLVNVGLASQALQVGLRLGGHASVDGVSVLLSALGLLHSPSHVVYTIGDGADSEHSLSLLAQRGHPAVSWHSLGVDVWLSLLGKLLDRLLLVLFRVTICTCILFYCYLCLSLLGDGEGGGGADLSGGIL